jgi:dihydrofolate reductase
MSRDGAAAARMAHNHEVPGSSPGPATKLKCQIEIRYAASLYLFSISVNKVRTLFSLCYTAGMKVIWSPAVTLDGNIAKADGNSDWPTETDGNQFHELIKRCGCVVVGRKTYDQYKGEVFPVDNAMTFVWTHSPQDSEEGVEYVTGGPEEVLRAIEGKGYQECVLAGGSTTNDTFVSAGLVDEISVTIYPLLFGSGMRLLSGNDIAIELELLDSSGIGDGVIRNRYKVTK